MVLITQSDTNEDSQNRQLRVSKKLSKAISSVPRSRFQKPRPKIPGSKRTESAVPAAARKTNEQSQADDNFVNSTALNTDETCNNNDTAKLTENSSTVETSQKDDTFENSVNSSLNANEPFQKNVMQIISEKLDTDDLSQNNNAVKVSEDITGDPSENNNAMKVSEDIITDETSQNEDKLEKNYLNIDETSQSNLMKISENINADETSQSNLMKISENINADEASHSDDTVQSITINTECIQDLPVEETPALDCIDSSDIPPIITANNTDKSSKYPHLTSILSKKRAEPKKEVQHKKRKKFKKGDAAPERSKMTMADLIYWNPANTDLPPKSAATEDEIPANLNIDEPEECPDADIPVEENNICGSVPKLVISEDGSINIDQSSLVVSRNIPEPKVTVVQKDGTTYSSFRKRPMTKHWSAKDTTVFYKALSLVGTDFGLMETIFPHRTRRELKLKFKREEKFNIDLINRAMYESHLTFDANTLGDLIKNLNDLTGDFSSENGQENTQSSVKEKKKPTSRKRKITKATNSIDPDVSDFGTESVINEVTHTNGDKVRTKRKRKAKKLPEDFIDTDEIEEIVLIEQEHEETSINDEACESNSTEIISEENLSNENEVPSQSKVSVPNSELNAVCETNIEILCIDDIAGVEGLEGRKAIFVPENASNLSQVITIPDSGNVNTSQTIALSPDNEEQCITLEYVDINQTENVSLLNNVMAFEVVTSNAPIPKRRRKVNFTPNVPKKVKKSCQPLQVSSTNYTPV